MDTVKEIREDILAGFDQVTKEKIVSSALNQARNLKKNLDYQIDDHDARTIWITKHKVAWHTKFTLSFACFVLFFIGAPLGAIIRKGGLGLPVVVSVLFFVLFHIISITGEKSAKAGAIEVHFGMWIASAILLPLGIFLTYKATTDSPLLDTDVWKRNFEKITRKLSKQKK
jgi:lipopolysaccharide export system permease protein